MMQVSCFVTIVKAPRRWHCLSRGLGQFVPTGSLPPRGHEWVRQGSVALLMQGVGRTLSFPWQLLSALPEGRNRFLHSGLRSRLSDFRFEALDRFNAGC